METWGSAGRVLPLHLMARKSYFRNMSPLSIFTHILFLFVSNFIRCYWGCELRMTRRVESAVSIESGRGGASEELGGFRWN